MVYANISLDILFYQLTIVLIIHILVSLPLYTFEANCKILEPSYSDYKSAFFLLFLKFYFKLSSAPLDAFLFFLVLRLFSTRYYHDL